MKLLSIRGTLLRKEAAQVARLMLSQKNEYKRLTILSEIRFQTRPSDGKVPTIGRLDECRRLCNDLDGREIEIEMVRAQEFVVGSSR